MNVDNETYAEAPRIVGRRHTAAEDPCNLLAKRPIRPEPVSIGTVGPEPSSGMS